MKANEEHIDLFDRYFNGELSTRERLHLEERLKSDPELNAAFQEYRDLVLGIEAVTPIILKANFSEIDKNISSSDLKDYSPQRTGKNRSKKERNWNIMMWFMIIGSGVLLVAFLIAIFNLPDLEEKLKKKKSKGSVERVITEEVEESSCTMVACLPPSMFDNYEGKMIVENGDTTYESFESRSFMVCPNTGDREQSIEMLLSSSGDTIKLWNMPCENVQLYYTPYNEEGILLECDSVLYHVTEEGHTVYQSISSDTVSLDTVYQDEEILEVSRTVPAEEAKDNKEKANDVGPAIAKDASFGQNIYQWMHGQIRFPESAKSKNISGKVVVGFTVDDKGMVQNARIKESLDPDFDAEVLRCIKLMPKWTPATVDGKPVSQDMTLPVKFTAPE